jgi:hypothetical protein
MRPILEASCAHWSWRWLLVNSHSGTPCAPAGPRRMKRIEHIMVATDFGATPSPRSMRGLSSRAASGPGSPSSMPLKHPRMPIRFQSPMMFGKRPMRPLTQLSRQPDDELQPRTGSCVAWEEIVSAAKGAGRRSGRDRLAWSAGNSALASRERGGAGHEVFARSSPHDPRRRHEHRI